ncbi:MAG: leucine-rich repeat domain-containing protein [Holosporaceae bacterium]|nr:leucine-rich repeat domain-containing protein [Holosporaceae bacterium]
MKNLSIIVAILSIACPSYATAVESSSGSSLFLSDEVGGANLGGNLEESAGVVIDNSTASKYLHRKGIKWQSGISIEDNVKAIANSAYKDCSTQIVELDLDKAVKLKSIGDFAFFRACFSNSIYLPHYLKSIGRYAFAGNPYLESISAGENASQLKVIGPFAFSGCISLKKFIFPSGLERIGEGAFAGCISLTAAKINGKTVVEKGAFAGCTGLKEVTIGGGANVEEGAFTGCHLLNKVNVVEGANIHPQAFDQLVKQVYCKQPQKLLLPNLL